MKLKLYAYLNIENPMVAWEVAVGRIRSSCDIESGNVGVSVWQYNLLRRASRLGLVTSIRHEFGLEARRKSIFSNKVSRLSGVYFFETEEMAHLALERWGLPARYKEYISEVGFSPTNFSRYDSEWITTYMLDECDGWYDSYLNGETLGISPLTEVIASGIGSVRNKQLRIKAYKKIYEEFPTATPILVAAMAGYCEGVSENAGLVVPYISLKGDKLYGEHLIYMKPLEGEMPEISKAMDRLRASNSLPSIHPRSIAEQSISAPDFQDLLFEMPLSKLEAQASYKKIHDS